MPPNRPISPEKAERKNLIVFGAFLAALVFFGGASRADELAQPIIRTCSILVLFWAFIQAPVRLSRPPLPIGLLAMLAAWMVIQIVPLPADIWYALPGREEFRGPLSAAGIADAWRPISMAPDLTLNALLALLPTAAALALLLRLSHNSTPWILVSIIVAMGVELLLGVVQASAGYPYFYRIVNEGSAVGGFSNRNHFALFIACLVPLLAAWTCTATMAERRGLPRNWLAICVAAAVFPMLLVTGSRGGILAGGLAALGAIAILATCNPSVSGARRVYISLGAAAGAAALGGIFFFFSRAEAVERLLADDQDELRDNLAPLLVGLIEKFLPFGSGFGSFDAIFRAAEPTSMLGPLYANQAHNDWLQLALEGGIPAFILIVVFAGWVVRKVATTWSRSNAGPQGALARAATVVITLIAVFSAFDYPLRTPMMGVLLAVMVSWLAGVERRDGRATRGN